VLAGRPEKRRGEVEADDIVPPVRERRRIAAGATPQVQHALTVQGVEKRLAVLLQRGRREILLDVGVGVAFVGIERPSDLVHACDSAGRRIEISEHNGWWHRSAGCGLLTRLPKLFHPLDRRVECNVPTLWQPRVRRGSRLGSAIVPLFLSG